MRRRLPSLQALQCLDAAARHESYTRAASELALTQGAVSRQIAQLEAQLGVALFARTRHGVRLTERGRAYAQRVAQRLAALEQDAQDASGSAEGGRTLHLACVPSLTERWLIPRLPALERAEPGLMLHIDVRTRPFLFADSGFDAALFSLSADQAAAWGGAQCCALWPEQLVAVAHPALLPGGQALTPQALAALPLIQQSTRAQAWRDWFAQLGVEATHALAGPRYELFSLSRAAALAGQGVALLPQALVQDELSRGLLRLACSARVAAQRHYTLVQPQASVADPALARLAIWLRAQAQDQPGAASGPVEVPLAQPMAEPFTQPAAASASV